MLDWQFDNPPEEGWYMIAYSVIRNRRKKTFDYIVDVAYWHRSHWELQGPNDYMDRIDAWAEIPAHPLLGAD
jgi:hypothetical protein